MLSNFGFVDPLFIATMDEIVQLQILQEEFDEQEKEYQAQKKMRYGYDFEDETF